MEIRASDEQHVYAWVYWMYRPDAKVPSTERITFNAANRTMERMN